MPLVLIFFAIVLLVAAYQNTVGTLASNIATDAQGFAKWFAALVIVGGLQWVPGLEKLARWLIGLVLLVLVLKNYTAIFQGFQNLTASSTASTAAVTSPAQAYVSNPSNPQITQAEVTGTGSTTGTMKTASVASQNLLAQFESSLPASMGFGGVA